VTESVAVVIFARVHHLGIRVFAERALHGTPL
jgi:hypothetical protein